MVNVSELLLNVVILNKLKLLKGLAQIGNVVKAEEVMVFLSVDTQTLPADREHLTDLCQLNGTR